MADYETRLSMLSVVMIGLINTLSVSDYREKIMENFNDIGFAGRGTAVSRGQALGLNIPDYFKALK